MNMGNPSGRYGSASIGLHWLMALLIAGAYAFIELHESFPKGSEPRALMKTLHFTLGLAVLALVIVRLVLRIGHPAPPIEPAPPRWQARIGSVTHVALYGLMVAAPLFGWLMLSLQGKPVLLFGWPLPLPVAPDRAAADWVKEIHETLGDVGYFVIGLHAAAALFHHYVVRDNALRRMLPGR